MDEQRKKCISGSEAYVPQAVGSGAKSGVALYIAVMDTSSLDNISIPRCPIDVYIGGS